MNRRIKRAIAFLLLIFMLFHRTVILIAAEPEIAAPSAILMEESTGKVIYERNADERKSPASITKIMTLILIFEAIQKGRIALTDEVVTSAYAKSMGGSQVFLEEGEIQSVETMIKCIVIASGNDASVAMAEYVSGSEMEFVAQMNEKAKSLGMNNTNFEDCCGLTASANHYTSARDVAVMSRELVTQYPQIFDYTKIWMEDIVHETARGSSTFTLSSTNKLIKQYPYATGLKTGSTSIAKYCLSATASKDDISLIAVVMQAPDYKVRFADAITLLNYGFSVSKIYKDDDMSDCTVVSIEGALVDEIPVHYEQQFRYLDTNGLDFSKIKKEIIIFDPISAPVQTGQTVAEAVYSIDGKEIGRVNIVADVTVERATLLDFFGKLFIKYLL